MCRDEVDIKVVWLCISVVSELVEILDFKLEALPGLRSS